MLFMRIIILFEFLNIRNSNEMDFVASNDDLITVNSNNNNNNSNNQQQTNNDSIDIASMLMHNEMRHEIAVDENQVINLIVYSRDVAWLKVL